MIVSFLLIVVLLGLGTYYFVFKKKPAEVATITEPVIQAPVVIDTIKTDTTRIDTAVIQNQIALY
jgi:hypothetical protein